MIVLGIDSSSISGCCAVSRDGEILANGFVNNGLTHSQTLLPMIKKTIDNASVPIENIDLIAVTHGPGSFTGLRIGMATVKGIAVAYGTPCVGVSSLEAIAAGVENFDGIICACMDARCKQLYNALFEYKNGILFRICEDRALYIDDLKSELVAMNRPVIVAGDGAQLCFEYMKNDVKVCIAEDNSVLIHGSSVVALGEKYSLDAVSANLITPTYLRLPQAQRELLKKKGNENK